jgi:pantothenate kinase
VKLSFRPDDKVKNVVFTINRKTGHVFRIVSSPSTTRAFVFVGDEHKNSLLATDLPKLVVNEWNRLEVDLRGKKLLIKFGEYVKTFESEALVGEKANVTIGFAFGTLSVKDVAISP